MQREYTVLVRKKKFQRNYFCTQYTRFSPCLQHFWQKSAMAFSVILWEVPIFVLYPSKSAKFQKSDSLWELFFFSQRVEYTGKNGPLLDRIESRIKLLLLHKIMIRRHRFNKCVYCNFVMTGKYFIEVFSRNSCQENDVYCVHVLN
jgi:hypothetical protein